MDNKELLENYRLQIDTLDKEMIYLLSRRFTIVNEIGNIKKQEWIQPLQQDRWKRLMNENIEVANDLWVSEWLIKDLWERIHKESLSIEK